MERDRSVKSSSPAAAAVINCSVRMLQAIVD